MKKMNFLKIAFTLVLAISLSTTFAQEIEGGAGVRLSVDNGTAFTVTVNKAVPFHVMPDIYFNPNYTVGGGWVVSGTEIFTWNSDGTMAGTSNPGTDATYSSTAVINPDITFPVTGAYVIGAQETNADCNGNIQLQTVNVIAAPSADFPLLATADVEQCGDYTGAINVNIAANTATNFLVDYTIVAQNYLADKTTPDGAAISTTPVTDVAFAAAGAAQELIASATYAVQNSKVTRYTVTIDGVNDAVSRVSDYIAPNGRAWPIVTFTNYASATDGIYFITVLPSPTTGPIYHLAN